MLCAFPLVDCEAGEEWSDPPLECVDCSLDEYQPHEERLDGDCNQCPIGHKTLTTGASALDMCISL